MSVAREELVEAAAIAAAAAPRRRLLWQLAHNPSVPLGAAERQMLIDFLDQQLGTSDVVRADSYLEEPLRMLTHLIMSQPEYQLG